MISIILLFASLLQVAFGGLLPRGSPESSGCIKSSKVPSQVECHQLIGAFSQKDPSGYITLQGKQTLELIFGSCGGTLFNKLATRARINEATLAVEMTDKIYNQCVINGMWGRWETDQYSIRIYYVDRNLSRNRSRHREGSENRLATPAKPKQKRDTAGTTCIEYQQPGPPPPVPEECRSAIDGLTSSGYFTVKQNDCAKHVAKGCAAYFCNNQDHEVEVNPEVLDLYFTTNIFDPCVVREHKYGMWEPDDQGMRGALYEAPPSEQPY